MADYYAATAAGTLPVHPTFTRGILASARATSEPMGARCLPDSSSSSTARTPSCLPASGRLPLGYVLEPPPEGFATWDDWRRDIGLPDSELGIGADSIIDPRGDSPRIWFHVVPAAKVVKNRLHLDIHVSGFPSRSDPLATRMQRVDAEARRLTDLGAT